MTIVYERRSDGCRNNCVVRAYKRYSIWREVISLQHFGTGGNDIHFLALYINPLVCIGADDTWELKRALRYPYSPFIDTKSFMTAAALLWLHRRGTS